MFTFYLMVFAIFLLFCGLLYAMQNGEDFFKVIDMKIWYDKKEDAVHFEFEGITNYFTLAGILILFASIITSFLKI